MAQISMTVRMDSKIKMAFDALCNQFGMSANAAMNIFANAVVMQRRIPFEIKAPEVKDSNVKVISVGIGAIILFGAILYVVLRRNTKGMKAEEK